MTERLVLNGLQIILVIAIISMAALYFHELRKAKVNATNRFVPGFLIGLVTDFGDTLGIGSFATTTALFKVTHFLDDDRKLPGTMNAAHAIPVFVEALLFLTAVKIELTTLIPMTLAAMTGAALGTRITANWPVRKMQRWLAIALALAAVFMLIKLVTNPGQGESLAVHGLHGWWLLLGIFVNFGLGILMTIGLGNYTPELIFFSLMGVNPLVAFPVMMMDAAMIMMTSAVNFVRTGRVEWRGLPAMIIGGTVGVIIAAKLVTFVNMTILSYFIVGIALLTAYNLFRDSRKEEPKSLVKKLSDGK
ncbi:sulfite exporter TauE/SafE family protein [Weissella muntiaci]|uniref:Probable membrane transporter protein n=1 Tax=Weissella muntiaci TaxID=2508881 RepID=A0A6C2C6R8_9LACO|nr:sulfite exporter TauE/SafE family protein [Weissella muntiaci]TYC49691.1 sulfite exporter TauE/SafE family protein [Weissella muntiaci]